MIAIARHPFILGSFALALLSAACGSSVETHGTGANGGSTGSGTTTVTTTTCPPGNAPCCVPGQQETCCIVCSGSSSGVGGFGGSPPGQPCGGFGGSECPPDQYCDFPDNLCGAADGPGVCTPKPIGCSDIWQPTCACDGKVYSSSCDAAAVGLDQNDLGGCTPPDGMFGCGSQFCSLADSYCEMITNDTGPGPSTFTCKPLPTSCAGIASCACLANVQCGFACAATKDGGFEVTCGGAG